VNWRLWIYGLLSGVIGAGASAASNVLVLPAVVNGITVRQLFIATSLNMAVAAGVGLFAYLKTHPLPEWSGVNRRNGG
jgi:hypothetical protein